MNGASIFDVNLASQPFKRERARNAGWGIACAALMVLLLILAAAILRARVQAADFRRSNNAQRTTLARLNRESSQFSTVLAKPKNSDVFSRSVFLNEVIARRAVSWTLVFRDLERLLPANVRLIGVRLPQVTGEGALEGAAPGTNRVQLDMLLGTDRPEAVSELLNRLSASEQFGSAKMLAQTPPNQNDPLYKFRVTVPYAQKL